MALPEELQALARRVSNRGRWGDDDQRGTLNLITPDAVRRGVAAVRTGEVLSLAIPFDADGPMWDFDSMPGRHNPTLDAYMVNVSFTGDPADFTTSDDTLTMGTQAATHWDALAHVGYEGRLYNDVPGDVVTRDAGAARLGAEQIGAVVTRGLLCDVARLHGVDWFEEPYPIDGDDLEACLDRAGLRAEPGDAVLVRTGQMAHRGDKQRYSFPSPGLSTRSIEWLRDHDVAAVATDTQTFECYPGEDDAVFFPVHMIHLRDMGLLQGQLWALDDLAEACAADGRHEFLLDATPLPLVGATGAPVAPTAVR